MLSSLAVILFVSKDVMLHTLKCKIRELYQCCVGDSEANVSPLQMLNSIENLLGDLMERIEVIPKEKMLNAKKAKEKERRVR